jgi:hypothetical protein
MKNTTRRTGLQQRLADSERAAKLVKQFLESRGIPDYLTNAVMDAISAAAQLKQINYWNEDGGDFDMDGLATLFLASQDVDLRHGPDAIAFHVSELLNNSECPTALHNAIGEAVCTIGSGKIGDSLRVVAAQVRHHVASEAEG